MTAGTTTTRLPAADLGAPITCLPLLNAVTCLVIRTVPAARSMSLRRKAASSPHRRLQKIASNTSAR